MTERAILHGLRRIGGHLTTSGEVSVPDSLDLGDDVEDALLALKNSVTTGVTPGSIDIPALDPDLRPLAASNPFPGGQVFCHSWDRQATIPQGHDIENIQSGDYFFFTSPADFDGNYSATSTLRSTWQDILGTDTNTRLGDTHGNNILYLGFHRASGSVGSKEYFGRYIDDTDTNTPIPVVVVYNRIKWVYYVGHFRGVAAPNGDLTQTAIRIWLPRVESYSLGGDSLTDTLPTGGARICFAYNYNMIPPYGATGLPLVKNSSTTWDMGWGQVGTAGLADGAATGAKIGADAIDGSKIADDAVANEHIANDAVGSAQIATNAVGSAEIASNSVGSSAIIDGSVNSSELADGSVTNAKIGADAVTGPKVADDAIGNEHIADDAVRAAQIQADAVGSSEIAGNAVGSSEIAAGAVGSTELATNAVTTVKITDANVTAAKLAADVIPETPRQERTIIWFRRTTSTPSAPTYNAYNGEDFSGGSANSFQDTVPTGSDPLWLAYVTVELAAGSSTWSVGTWSVIRNSDPSSTTFDVQYSSTINGTYTSTVLTSGFVKWRVDGGAFVGPFELGAHTTVPSFSLAWQHKFNFTNIDGNESISLSSEEDIRSYNDVCFQVRFRDTASTGVSSQYIMQARNIETGNDTTFAHDNGVRIFFDRDEGISLTTNNTTTPMAATSPNQTAFTIYFQTDMGPPNFRHCRIRHHSGVDARLGVWMR